MFSRILTFVWQDLVRNWWLSFITLTVLFLTLLSVNLVVVWSVVTNHALESIQKKVDVSIYIDPVVKEIQTDEMRRYIEQFPDVQRVVYVSRDDALAKFRERHVDDAVVLESLKELNSNPFGAELVITATSVDAYGGILEKIASSPYQSYIRDKSFGDHRAVIDRMTAISIAAKKIGILTSSIFALITLLIVFNTIRITIYTHQIEIGIMKRVGATNWFTRTPFLLESVFVACIACILSTGLFFLLLRYVQPTVAAFFAEDTFDLMTYFLYHGWIFAIEFVVVMAFTALSAMFAVRRYLRV